MKKRIRKMYNWKHFLADAIREEKEDRELLRLMLEAKSGARVDKDTVLKNLKS